MVVKSNPQKAIGKTKARLDVSIFALRWRLGTSLPLVLWYSRILFPSAMAKMNQTKIRLRVFLARSKENGGETLVLESPVLVIRVWEHSIHGEASLPMNAHVC
ncbi:hypothetical protein Nepgr_009908 [Nepenthes gracilis]|uniref:Uncharacterized protein n=1 Tax=Nepenthes gracilis TaxID=150966 RepID=A0AAD3XKK5_NEPGR|nr:hypothetical protein Nepgr_009908 [Nepenthes gracilis]